jgi:hypothetical protein
MSPGNFEFTSRILPLAPGMYIFRFATRLGRDQQVFISLQHSLAGNGSVAFFASADVHHNTLRKLGDCIVLRVDGEAASVLITQYSPAGQPPSVVDLRVDRIDTSEAIVRARPAPAPARVAELPLTPVPSLQRPAASARKTSPRASAHRS